MLQPIKKSQKFQEEVNKYSDAISKMPDSKLKEDTKRLLNNLINEVKKLDDVHMEMVYQKQLPSLGGEMRSSITTIRRELNRKFEEFKKTQVTG